MEGEREKEGEAGGRAIASKSIPSKGEIYKPLTLTFGKINQMSLEELRCNLRKLTLCSSGTRDVLMKRLKNHYKTQKLSSLSLLPDNSCAPYYVVVDFEATCNAFNPPDYPHEIIEFPAILVSSKERAIIDQFQSYVRPEISPILSPFCIELTGITQEVVNLADTFEMVLRRFESWLSMHGLQSDLKWVLVTDGPWDMAQFLHGQCKIAGIPYPKWAKKWLNVRKVFRNYYRGKMCNLKSMLDTLGLEFEGRPHCGLDDAHNIARILLTLMNEGAPLKINERLDLNQYKGREKVLLASATAIVQKRSDGKDLLTKLQQISISPKPTKEKRESRSLDAERKTPASACSSASDDSVESDDAEDSILWANNKFSALSKARVYSKS